ncbi:MAG: hypothetical protein AB7D01_01795 [Methanoculleus sp.]
MRARARVLNTLRGRVPPARTTFFCSGKRLELLIHCHNFARTGFIEVPLSYNETVRIAKSYREKIVEYCGNYYLIDFFES